MQFTVQSVVFIFLLGALRARGQCDPICGTFQQNCWKCVGGGQRCGITKAQVIPVYFCVPCCGELDTAPVRETASKATFGGLVYTAGVVMMVDGFTECACTIAIFRAARDAMEWRTGRGLNFRIREVEQRAGELGKNLPRDAENGHDLKNPGPKSTTKNRKWCEMHKGIAVQMLEQRHFKSAARCDVKIEARSCR
ncbi:hypothetical protein C8J57DRAFT_1245921 [Mycena rebaudengoi]|nr:hypothetical protein C8J57DRAFT_1245921 [Mycena rebaudengoi]